MVYILDFYSYSSVKIQHKHLHITQFDFYISQTLS